MLKIYGVYRSRASRVYWMAEELGIPFEYIPVLQSYMLADPAAAGAPLNTRSPEFLAINPMALIPSIKDGDLVMHESLAITEYLAKKHGGPLAPKTLEEDALINMWTIWAASEVEVQTFQLVKTYDNALEKTEGGKSVIAVASRQLKRPLDVLELHLTGREWIAADRFTAADLNVAEVLRYAQSEQALFDARPNIDAWIKRCQSRPAYLKMQAGRTNEPV
ncbi:glutathione S-transferase family protein [Rhizobium sp. BE258]|uniref:glutathione S-transferase family protein n=1 Tax=Rhizobium sp. BE258 TaxID=2817722 RepID=UPI00285C5631|nr:glutathione S-transferase family protein [Rhizobium sp. BE258]MDR7143006.1 glutathione S-transferase [Rhizobium sp. BE258]